MFQNARVEDAFGRIADAETGAAAFRILRPGRNCWRIEAASRLALVTNTDYFAALADSMRQARRQILLLGWKIDPLLILDPAAPGPAALPLHRFLAALLAARPELEIRLLLWNRTIFYGGNGKAPPLLEAARRACPRLDFRFRSAPLATSRHEKLVAIDDEIAYLGGIDLTSDRWDHTDHPAEHPHRVTPDGERYGPIHDLQMLVEGRAARALADYARRQWERCSGETLPAVAAGSAWPCAVAADLRDQPVAIARTDPWHPRRRVREVARLNLAALARARRVIYIEAQYLTAGPVGRVLAAQLRRPDGPEVIIVVTHHPRGWLERLAMATNRDRLLRRLRAADRWGRLRACYPVVDPVIGSGGGAEAEVKIHAKLVIVDDCFLRVGSSNLNNRSLAVDSECDLAVEGVDAASRAAIAAIRDRLVAAQLHLPVERLRAAVAAEASLGRAIDALDGGRHLRPLPALLAPGPSAPILGTAVLDPLRPISFAAMLRRLRRSLWL
jgi:phosphatidylserine/phosphatidylglycerophosphate/cardiolipin synthase-like enzyme